MKALHELKDMLLDCLEEIQQKGTLSAGDLDAVDKLTHSVKSIDAILKYDNSNYSEDHRPMMYDDYRMDGRDGMGRRIDGVSYRGRRGRVNNPRGINQYSREGDKDHLIRKMEEMLDQATPEEQRIIRKCIDELGF